LAPACKHKETICRTCKKRGHLARVCLSGTKGPNSPSAKKAHHVGASAEAESELPLMESPEYDPLNYVTIDVVRDDIGPPILLDFTLNQVPVQFELDTGAAVSILNKATYEKVLRSSQLPPLSPAKSS